MLGDDNLRHTTQVITTIILINLIVFRTVDKAHHIGILLDGSRFTKVTQLRTFTINTFTTFHTTIQLRQCDDRNIQLFRQSFQRTGNGTNLFLTATKRHTARIHQLKVVNNNDSHPMFTYQTTRFCSKFKYRQRRSIIHVKRCIHQILQFIVQLLPLITGQLSALDLSTLNLANIRNQTVHQLNVTHFKRKQRHRIPIIDSNILSHRKDKGGLTHRRTCSNNDKVGILPTGSHLVELCKTTLKTTQTIGSRRSLLNQLIGFVNHRIDLRIILFHVLLRNLKKFTFRFLHQVVHIQRFIKRFTLDIARKRNQLTRQRFLCNNTGVILNMR